MALTRRRLGTQGVEASDRYERVKYLLENVGSLKVKLTLEDMKELDIPESDVAGERYAQS